MFRRRQRLVSKPSRQQSRWPKRVFLTLFVVSIAVLAGWAAIDLLDAASALRSAEQRIDKADAALLDARVGDAERYLTEAEEFLEDANNQLRFSPGLVIARRLPVTSQNLSALDRTIETAATLVHGGRKILATSEELQDASGDLAVELVEGSIPADAVENSLEEIRALLVSLSSRSEPSSGFFVLPQLQDVQDRVYDEVAVQEDHLVRLRAGLAILDQLVGVEHPRRTLLAVANTAEMRGSGGMMLNYGVLEASGGSVTIDEFGRVGELPVNSPPDPDSIGIPEDYQQRWANFDYTRDWRNATLSGDFTQDAPTLLAMFRSATKLRADNVIQVDAHALSAILSVTGPVQVEGLGVVKADNVVSLVLNEAYVLFPDRDTRADILGDVAEATFRALVNGSYPSVSDLAEALADAVEGRHLMMYSSDESVQTALERFGATGSLPDPQLLDYMHLTVQNMGGNKLDYYVDTAIDVVGKRPPGEIGELTVTVSVTNDAPPGVTEPRYIFGPSEPGQTAGTYRGAVSLYVPQGTSLSGADGDEFYTAPSTASEAGRAVVTYWVEVPAGSTHTAELTLTMPPTSGDDDYSLLLVPSPRVRPTTATVAIDVKEGLQASGSVTLDVPWEIGLSGAVPARDE